MMCQHYILIIKIKKLKYIIILNNDNFNNIFFCQRNAVIRTIKGITQTASNEFDEWDHTVSNWQKTFHSSFIIYMRLRSSISNAESACLTFNFHEQNDRMLLFQPCKQFREHCISFL